MYHKKRPSKTCIVVHTYTERAQNFVLQNLDRGLDQNGFLNHDLYKVSNSSRQFRSVRERPKPRYPLLSDSSSCGGDDNSEHNHTASFAAAAASEDAIEVAADRVRRLDLDQRRDTGKGVVAGPWEPCSAQPEDQADGKGSEDAGEVVKVKKKSFWQKLLGKKSNKESGSS